MAKDKNSEEPEAPQDDAAKDDAAKDDAAQDDAAKDDAAKDDAAKDDAAKDDAAKDDAAKDDEDDEDADDEEGDDEEGDDEEGDDEEGDVDDAPVPTAESGNTESGNTESGNTESGRTEKSAPRSKKGKVTRAEQVRAARKKKKGSPTRNIVLFVALVAFLALAFTVIGKKTGGGQSNAKTGWKKGLKPTVEITVVPDDQRKLACAYDGDVEGRHCGFLTQTRKNTDKPKDPSKSDKLLQPYTTTDGKQFLAAGLWMAEATKKKVKEVKENPSLPQRFSVKCTYVVEGTVKTASVQWSPGSWHPGNGWNAGYLENCK